MNKLTAFFLIVFLSATIYAKPPKYSKNVKMNYMVPANAMRMGIEKVQDSTYHYWFRRMVKDDYLETFQFVTKEKTISAESFDLDCKSGKIIRDGLYQRSFKGEVINEGHYKDNYRDGYFWLKNNKGDLIQKQAYKWDGKNEISLIYYLNRDESVAQKTHFKGKKKHGQETIYYENGQPMQTCEYSDGEKNGELLTYYPNGNIRRVEVYKNNSFVSGEMLDENGDKMDWKPAEWSSIDGERLMAIKADIDSIVNSNIDKKQDLVMRFTLLKNGTIPAKSCKYKTSLKKAITNQITRYLSALSFNPSLYEDIPVATTFEVYLHQISEYDYQFTFDRINATNGLSMIYKIEPATEDGKILTHVEKMPEYPGGADALRKFIAENVKYPVKAQVAGIQGKVYVSFIIDKEGKVNDIKIAKSVDINLDKEAMRVVSLMPKWTPGYENNKPVNVSYTIPINFHLDRANAFEEI